MKTAIKVTNISQPAKEKQPEEIKARVDPKLIAIEKKNKNLSVACQALRQSNNKLEGQIAELKKSKIDTSTLERLVKDQSDFVGKLKTQQDIILESVGLIKGLVRAVHDIVNNVLWDQAEGDANKVIEDMNFLVIYSFTMIEFYAGVIQAESKKDLSQPGK